MGYYLILNPGSTSTKIGLFEGEKALFTKNISHTQQELNNFHSIVEQKEYRTEMILNVLSKQGYDLKEIEGIISIGGLIKPGEAGVYRVNEEMISDLMQAKYDEHASNLGALIAWEFSKKLNISVYVADPITADEMQDVARISGVPEITRIGRSHTLNQKSMATKAAKELNREYKDCNFIVAHLGGGISVTAHKKGKMVDTNNARGEGPFCMDRAGGVNTFQLVKLCFSGKYSKEEMLKKINGNGGVVAYLNTRDFREVCHKKEQEDSKAKAVFDALAYQVAKEIGAMAVVLRGNIDAIILTGGMANSTELVKEIKEQTDFLSERFFIYPGESELEALAAYLSGVKNGTIFSKEYKS